MKKTIILLISMILICVLAVNFSGCTIKIQAKNLMEDITPNYVKAVDDLKSKEADVTDFAIRLFKASEEKGKNTLISPLSVLCALAMTANGAEEETLHQMEAVLGMTTEELNLYLYSYIKSLPKSDKNKLSLANSIWFTEDERFTVNRDFLQTTADYYGADIYKAPFDEQTCKDINNWVKQNTDGMINEILDEISPEAVMYLVNALAFEAEWVDIYKESQVKTDIFTKEDGTKQTVDFMYGEERFYLEDEKAIGFMKYYKDCKYAFVAMLPKKDASVSELVASLNGEALHALLENKKYGIVNTSIPKFEIEYQVEMSKILQNMGITKAFDYENAEFERLGLSNDGNIYINSVLHKTFISVGEKGTKAGAATVVEMADSAAIQQQPKEIYLNRPFVYMLVDCENNVPFFIGTMMEVE